MSTLSTAIIIKEFGPSTQDSTVKGFLIGILTLGGAVGAFTSPFFMKCFSRRYFISHIKKTNPTLQHRIIMYRRTHSVSKHLQFVHMPGFSRVFYGQFHGISPCLCQLTLSEITNYEIRSLCPNVCCFRGSVCVWVWHSTHKIRSSRLYHVENNVCF